LWQVLIDFKADVSQVRLNQLVGRDVLTPEPRDEDRISVQRRWRRDQDQHTAQEEQMGAP
jgi:hypothetical protein